MKHFISQKLLMTIALLAMCFAIHLWLLQQQTQHHAQMLIAQPQGYSAQQPALVARLSPLRTEPSEIHAQPNLFSLSWSLLWQSLLLLGICAFARQLPIQPLSLRSHVTWFYQWQKQRRKSWLHLQYRFAHSR
ncbi:hypothetical protein VST7929_03112 [Vibrio stylophorae]|uniref:Uncharacterized protein n=1 Tax=Vibrio stylophorae TaxID=659351 RepID=A0ABN8DWY1_9VIBR|nr:hypothetical protein [Vibrio stylophorae]CAH0535554.1 hypothetical protein VST7929_03112 [Vibrio stylophorae]